MVQELDEHKSVALSLTLLRHFHVSEKETANYFFEYLIAYLGEGPKHTPEHVANVIKHVDPYLIPKYGKMWQENIDLALTPLFAENFDEEELKQLISFFASPVGQKWVKQHQIAALKTVADVSELTVNELFTENRTKRK